MKNKRDFIGNAQIVDFDNLPKINKPHPVRAGCICIAIKIIDFKDNYIIYQARFCEKDSLRILDDFYINCFSYTYAVKNIEKEKREKLLYGMED